MPSSLGTRLILGTVAVCLGGLLLWRLAAERGGAAIGSVPGAAPEAHEDALRLADGRLPNVLLLTVDTLRADHAAALMPALDALEASGTIFLETTTPAPATLPALAGLHSGAYVHRHHVVSNRSSMPEQIPLLSELLRRHGYATAAFLGNGVLKPRSGFGRGFTTYVSFVGKNGFVRDQDGVAMALRWIASGSREPWFVWLHLMSPHGPYNSSPRSPRAAGVPDALPDVDLVPSTSNYGLGPIIPRYQRINIPPRAADYRRRYRDEVVFVDAQIASLLSGLGALGLRDSTLLIFAADHGEGLGEHDYFFQHGWLANEPSVHVPMVWSLPGRIAEGNRVTSTTSLVDVMPTLLAGLGIPPPPVDGRNLGAALSGEQIPDAAVFVLTVYPNQVTAARRGAWKLVHTPNPPQPLPLDQWHDFYAPAESWKLHDLERDPGESRDVSAAEPSVLDGLWRQLAAWEKGNGIPTGTRSVPSIDAESLERLRALGYAE